MKENCNQNTLKIFINYIEMEKVHCSMAHNMNEINLTERENNKLNFMQK